MVQDKQLLLQVLSAMLPYGVVLDVDTTDWRAPQGHIKVKIEGIGILFKDMSLIVNGCYYGDKYKPYLRPMSSMTEEEKEELKKLSNEYLEDWTNSQTSIDKWKLDAKISYKRSVFYNSHYLDWNGLIELGLALEAPEGMYL